MTYHQDHLRLANIRMVTNKPPTLGHSIIDEISTAKSASPANKAQICPGIGSATTNCPRRSGSEVHIKRKDNKRLMTS